MKSKIEEKMNRRSYLAGYMLGLTLYLCTTIAIIALTIKFLMWLF